jgi:hypothetical protein
LQDTPLQILPVQPDRFVLAHPLLFCGLDAVATCEALAEELAEITDGFGTTVMDGPNGHGIYLTYEGVIPALDRVLSESPAYQIALEDDTSALVHLLLFCELDGADTCDDLADELAEISPGFGTVVMDGPQGLGVYLIYERAT